MLLIFAEAFVEVITGLLFDTARDKTFTAVPCPFISMTFTSTNYFVGKPGNVM